MKISVIIPAYNIEDCIERCIRSVSAQTFRDIEIIVADDGSKDRTAQIARDLAKADPRITVLEKENGGTSSARNFGLDHATGDYIGFVDADDYISPDMYERLAGHIERTPGLVMTQVCRDELDEEGKSLPMVVTPPAGPTVTDTETFLKELLLHRGDCSMCTKLTDRRLFKEHRFPEGELNEDFRILTEMMTDPEFFGEGASPGIGSLPDICYHVCYRSGSNTRTDRTEFSRVFKDIVVNADRVSALTKALYPGLKEYTVRFGLVQRLDYLLHIPVRMMKRSDKFYAEVVSYVRSHRPDIRTNPYLSEDERKKLLILSVSPGLVRYLHGIMMRLKRLLHGTDRSNGPG